MNQPDLFSGQELRDIGMKQATDHADQKIEKWSDRAYDFLLEFIKTNKEFMAEDVRNASEGTLELPPSNRAWGSIFVKAARAGMIKRKGYRQVKNAKAHCTPATLWEVLK